MTYENLAESGLNYYPCRYGKSRLLFRGPRRRLEGDYVVVIGGTETYGKFVEEPYPALLERKIGMSVVNFGAINAGVDVFASDETILDTCSGARAVVVQILGAQNLTNRYYSVHPRRNDRFLKASNLLRMLYPKVDFTEFHFTRHLIQSLDKADPCRFASIRAELQEAWTSRMSEFIASVSAPVFLLWMADRDPEEGPNLTRSSDPLFITAEMLNRLRNSVAGIVSVRPSEAARAAGQAGMVFSQMEAPAACEVPNAAMHKETAEALAVGLRGSV